MITKSDDEMLMKQAIILDNVIYQCMSFMDHV